MRTRGFTLLELLVAVTITLLLAGLMLSVTTTILAQMRRAQGGSMATIEGKLALDQLERDLQGAILRTGGGRVWLDARVVATGDLVSHGWKMQTTPVMKPTGESDIFLPETTHDGGPEISRGRFGVSGVWLRLITSDYDSDSKNTVPVAVSYQVVRREVSSASGSPVRYAFYRVKKNAEDTFGIMSAPFGATDPSDLIKPSTGDVIASNVVDFGIWFYARNASGLFSPATPLFPTGGRTSTSPGTFPGMGNPAHAKMMIRILTEEGAAVVQSIEEGRVTPPAGISVDRWWWQVVAANSFVFTREVELAPSGP
jgi:prepilin-type N-terminal cleavage/methylation domain-containing protein